MLVHVWVCHVWHQVWTAHESAARELMSLELEDMQQQVDKMSNEELAQVAMRMMEVRHGREGRGRLVAAMRLLCGSGEGVACGNNRRASSQQRKFTRRC